MHTDLTYLEDKAFDYRKRFIELFTHMGFGHITSAFSWTEIATVLMNSIFDYSKTPDGSFTDKIVVSKGHGAGMLFPVFEDKGLINKEAMMDSMSIGGSNLELRKLYYPGFDFYGGALAIGLGFAAGMAVSQKISSTPGHIYCIVGDAECNEGAIWEAVAFAAHNKLSNLIVIIDRNGLGCSDFTEHMLAMNPLAEKWAAFNWETTEINGHNVNEVYDALNQAVSSSDERPKCIVANTKKGKGLDYLIDKPLMHGYMPKGEDIDKAYRELKHVHG